MLTAILSVVGDLPAHRHSRSPVAGNGVDGLTFTEELYGGSPCALVTQRVV